MRELDLASVPWSDEGRRSKVPFLAQMDLLVVDLPVVLYAGRKAAL